MGNEQIFQRVFQEISIKQNISFLDERLVYGWNHKSCGRKAELKGEIVWVKVIYRPLGEKKGVFNDKLWAGADSADLLKIDEVPKIILINSGNVDAYEYKFYVMEYSSSNIVSSSNFLSGDEDLKNFQLQKVLDLTLELSKKSSVSRVALNGDYMYRRIQSVFKNVSLPNLSSLQQNVSHGDMHWGNIMKSGTVLDWENWGMRVRGADLAQLYSVSLLHQRISKKIFRYGEQELTSTEGRVALLYAYSEVVFMNRSYGDFSASLAEKCLIEGFRL